MKIFFKIDGSRWVFFSAYDFSGGGFAATWVRDKCILLIFLKIRPNFREKFEEILKIFGKAAIFSLRIF